MIRFTGALLLLALIFTSTPAWAKPDLTTGTLQTAATNRTLTLPQAADNALVISLGTAVDPQTNKKVEGFAFIHYKESFNHNSNHIVGGQAKNNNSCYSFLARGAAWKSEEPWIVNTNNASGLSQSFVFSAITADIVKWESAAGADILGNGTATSDTLSAETASPDGSNEVYFADISSSGAIAVTTVWGYFSGPPSSRELVEWDMVFDDVDFDWSDSGAAGKMDFENIDTHELGHAVGLGHPGDSCTEETMYRFASDGETKKRDLNTGDAAGIVKLYAP